MEIACLDLEGVLVPEIWIAFAEKTGIDPAATVETVRGEYEGEQTKAHELKKQPHLRRLPDYWKPYHRGKFKEEYEVETGITREELAEITAESFGTRPP